MAGKKQDDAADAGFAPWAEMTDADWESLDEVSRNLMQASLQSQKLMSDVVQKALEGEPVLPKADPFNSAPEFGEVWNQIVHRRQNRPNPVILHPCTQQTEGAEHPGGTGN